MQLVPCVVNLNKLSKKMKKHDYLMQDHKFHSLLRMLRTIPIKTHKEKLNRVNSAKKQ